MRNDKPRSGGKPARPFGPRPRPALGTKRPFEKSRDEKKDRRDTAERSENPRTENARSENVRFGKARPSFDGGKTFGKKYGDDRKPPFRKNAPQRSQPVKAPPRGEDVRRINKDGSRDTVLIWGLHAARAAWINPQRKIHRIWLTEAGQKLFATTQEEAKEELLKRPDAKIQDRSELDRITPPGSVHQGIIIETSPLPEMHLNDIIGTDSPPDLILMLDQVTDPHNVGAILRSAAAFGAGAVILTERNAPTTTGVLAKSASGALEVTPMIHVVNLARAMEDLRNAGYWCVGLAEEGEKTLGDMDMSGRTVLVLGNEGEGLRHLTRQKCDELARLPTGGPVGSLNVSNAAAVALYEARRQAKKD